MSRNQSQYSCLSDIWRSYRGSVSLPTAEVVVSSPSISRRLLAIFLIFSTSSLAWPAVGQAGDNSSDTAAGFIFDHHALTLEPGTRTEAAGPFYYEQETELARTWAVPPFYSSTSWLDGDGAEMDIAYPFLTYDRFGGEYRWQLLQLLSIAGGRNQAENSHHRFSIFPFYFQQRSAESNQNYTALFPVYGHLENRIFRSEIDFALWPLYVKTIKRPSAGPAREDASFAAPVYQWLDARRGDVTTYNYVMPFFHLRYGDGLFGWQLWPLLGHESKVPTTHTNNWGDAEQIPGHDKRMALWPIYSYQQRGLGSTNVERELLVVPFYQQLRSPQRDSTSYLTPFGLTITEDRARKYREVSAPWPFLIFARGEGKTVNRVWPLFGQAYNASLRRDFYLWPVVMYRNTRGETLDRHRTRLLFFLGSHTLEKNTATGATKTRTDLWPLFTHRREYNGKTRLQILAPLEPILPANKSVERNYSPLWSLWRAEHNPGTRGSHQSFLWNLYRRDVTPTTRKGSLLFGLIQYESRAETKRWRLFYLPLTKSQKVSEHVPEYR